MTSIPVNDYLSKIALLENRVGAKATYKILNPFSLGSRDVIGIQKAAKTIAEFVGLGRFTFIVSIAQQARDVAGHVELKYSQQEVFVEISQDTADCPLATLATLAHEVTHKYLHFHGISVGTGPAHTYENEVLTDVAAVFLGLGKLMLNCVECQIIDKERIGDTIKTTTHTLKSGYLNRTQLSFIYLLACCMRGISQQTYEQGLTTESVSALNASRTSFPLYFDSRFRKADAVQDIVDDLQTQLIESEIALGTAKKAIEDFQQLHLSSPEAFILQAKERMQGLALLAKNEAARTELDPCLQYLSGIRFAEQSLGWAEEIRSFNSQITEIIYKFDKLNGRFHQSPERGEKPTPPPFLKRVLNVFRFLNYRKYNTQNGD